jgi:hypothetical protein
MKQISGGLSPAERTIACRAAFSHMHRVLVIPVLREKRRDAAWARLRIM